LVLGAIGDVLLMFESQRAFLGGLVAFLLGHLAYVVAFARTVPPARWIEGGMLVVVAATLVAAAIVLRWLWPRLGAMRIPVIGYVAVITSMVVGGIAVATPLATAGAIAFYASDLAVARDKFVAKDVWNRAIGLPLYYGAQLLIAWSVAT
ncbi:MAG: lysoplasmalogenase, partial [Kofleriaceae bacterium]